MESKSGRHFRMMPLPTPQGCHRGGMCIVDVTSMTFHQIVMDNEKVNHFLYKFCSKPCI